MSMKMVCDRCGHVKDKVDIFAHITYKTMTTSNNIDYEEYDICSVCAEQFERFMNGCEVDEEDLYKDSKPCDVIIHKLGNGNYAIENAPNGEEDAMDKEESDLSTPCHTNTAGVTVPDGYPWGKADKVCPRCGGDGYERGTDGIDIRGECHLCKGTGRIKGGSK